jgi:hypothetical protein
MLTEFMSMEHTPATLTWMRPRTGDGLYTNRRRKMTDDTSRGDHDTLMAASPQDLLPVNGASGRPTGEHFEIIG